MTVTLVYDDVHIRNYSLTFVFNVYFAGMACMARVCKWQE